MENLWIADSESEHRLLMKYSTGCCDLCRTPEPELSHPLVINHVIPRSMGGSQDRQNTWVLCVQCRDRVNQVRSFALNGGNSILSKLPENLQ